MRARPAAQLYAVRRAFGEDPAGTLGAIAEAGFECVEPYNLLSHGDVLRRELPASGLVARTAHEHLFSVDETAVFDLALELGVETIVVPLVSPTRWLSPVDVADTAEALGAAAERAEAHGLRIAYHNHWFEFRGELDGVSAFDWFLDRLDARVAIELDAYWATVGGADAVALLERLGARARFLHLKDGPLTLEPADELPLGRGELPLPAILAAAGAAELVVLELDGDVPDAVSALAEGLRYLRRLEDSTLVE